MSAPALEHHREGAGDPLLLVHGVGHHWQAWRPVVALLARDFDVVAVDLPGFGRSAPLPAGVEPTVHAYTAAVAEFARDLGLDRPHVAGNSMGGAIALELARRRAVRSATALSPAGFWTARERRYAQISLLATARMPHVLRPAILALAARPAARAALLAQLCAHGSRVPADEARATLRDAWASPVFAEVLAAFDGYAFARPQELRGVPVTVAWGARDRLLPFGRQAPRAQRLLPWARHVALGTGHLPYHDDPAATAEVIRATARGAPGPG